jgi:hypothetical protein
VGGRISGRVGRKILAQGQPCRKTQDPIRKITKIKNKFKNGLSAWLKWYSTCLTRMRCRFQPQKHLKKMMETVIKRKVLWFKQLWGVR